MAAEFTDAEKLEVVEHFLDQWRPARSSDISGERDTFLTLKAIAADIRARKPDAPGRARDRLRRAISDAKDMKTDDGYRARDLRTIAETVISEWPVIQRCLEHFEQQEKTDG